MRSLVISAEDIFDNDFSKVGLLRYATSKIILNDAVNHMVQTPWNITGFDFNSPVLFGELGSFISLAIGKTETGDVVIEATSRHDDVTKDVTVYFKINKNDGIVHKMESYTPMIKGYVLEYYNFKTDGQTMQLGFVNDNIWAGSDTDYMEDKNIPRLLIIATSTGYKIETMTGTEPNYPSMVDQGFAVAVDMHDNLLQLTEDIKHGLEETNEDLSELNDKVNQLVGVTQSLYVSR